jgi:lipoate-protein ligase A
MHYLNLTLPAPEQNLACDEVLLQICEENHGQSLLRFWMPEQYFIVLGYSNQMNSEVNVQSCKKKGISIQRRCSGGGTVLQGPGCLNYSLILPIDHSEEFKNLTKTNQFIMNRNREALQSIVSHEIKVQGHTDLTINDLKFSGNAQRRGRSCILFHGSILYQFSIPLMDEALLMPSQEPDYRRKRSHTKFVTNLPVESSLIIKNLQNAWDADEDFVNVPIQEIQKLADTKYSTRGWIEKV